VPKSAIANQRTSQQTRDAYGLPYQAEYRAAHAGPHYGRGVARRGKRANGPNLDMPTPPSKNVE
jgi:hypothetical protein